MYICCLSAGNFESLGGIAGGGGQLSVVGIQLSVVRRRRTEDRGQRAENSGRIRKGGGVEGLSRRLDIILGG